MTFGTERTITVLRAIVHEVRVERITFMAGSVAYHAFVSLLPLLFLLLAIVSAIGDRRLETSLVELTQAVVTPGAGEVLVAELRNVSVGASILGLAVLVWGMLRIFRSLDVAFSNIYETESENTFTDQLIDGTIASCSLGAVVLGVVALESVFAARPTFGGFWIGQRLLLGIVVSVAFLPMYYLFPDEPDMTVREVVPGVLFAGFGLVALESSFGLYVQYSSTPATNGILAGIIVFLTWLYVSSLVILLGVVVNAVLSNRSEDVDVRPVVGGAPSVEPDGDDAPRTRGPEGALDELERTLPQARELRIAVDDDGHVELPAPDEVSVDAVASRVPFADDTTALTLTWSRSTTEVAAERER